MRLGAIALVLALVAAPTALHGEEPKAPSRTDVVHGDHWVGAEVTKEDLVGKVVLFILWGSCVGCKEVAPEFIWQAKRLDGKPFHLIASHAQDIESRKVVTARLVSNGMSPSQPNLTITKNGRVPGVRTRVNKEGLRVMPYYFVFDYRGKLAAHGMGGAYHGGDGWAMFGIVDELLAKTPAVYVGPEPYVLLEDLAAQASKGKRLGDVAKKIDRALAGDPDAAKRTELERLRAALTRYRDQRMGYAANLENSAPGEVLPTLAVLARTFKGTTLAAAVEAKQSELKASERLAAGVFASNSYTIPTRAPSYPPWHSSAMPCAASLPL